jgi:hypothetical protein
LSKRHKVYLRASTQQIASFGAGSIQQFEHQCPEVVGFPCDPSYALKVYSSARAAQELTLEKLSLCHERCKRGLEVVGGSREEIVLEAGGFLSCLDARGFVDQCTAFEYDSSLVGQ